MKKLLMTKNISMEYLKVEWFHNNEYDPYLIYCEINSLREEIRKVEVFRNNQLGYTDKNIEMLDTRLSLTKIPSNEEINSQKEFSLQVISQDEFEEIWLMAKNNEQFCV